MPGRLTTRVAVVLLLLSAPAVFALSVTAPPARSASVSGTSDAPTLVGTDTWSVTSLEPLGATFMVSAPAFEHVTVGGQKANIKLNMTKLSGSSWVVVTGEDTSTPSLDADVLASSSLAGDGSFEVKVTFVPGDISVLPTGDYQTVITGTISANP